MGTMALLRQLYYDADWYAKGNVSTKDRSIEAFNQNKSQIQIIEAGSRANALRADTVGDDLVFNMLFLGWW